MTQKSAAGRWAMLRQPRMLVRSASRASPWRSTGRPLVSCTCTRPAITATSSLPLWATFGRRGRPGREPHEVGAQAGLGVVEQRHRGAGGRRRRVVAAAEPVAGRDVAAQQLVDGDVQVGGQREQRLEREPALAALGLRDGARRDLGQLGELGLAQLALHAHGPQRAAEAGGRRRLGELGPAVGEAVVVHAALHADRPALGLGDPQAAVAQRRARTG